MIDPRVVYLCAPPVCIIPSTKAHWSDVRVARKADRMQNEIVRKLNCQLKQGFEREADVLYVMAEVRKLFEHVRTIRKFPVLAFYSNWALHSRIDREPWAKQGLKRLEEVVSGFNSGTHDAEAVLRGVTGLLSFQRLHAEFLGFGAENNIQFDQLSNEEWRQFSTRLVDVLVDCPIVSELDTTTVKTLSLSRDFAFSHAGEQTLAFWKIDLGQGKVMAGPIF